MPSVFRQIRSCTDETIHSGRMLALSCVVISDTAVVPMTHCRLPRLTLVRERGLRPDKAIYGTVSSCGALYKAQ